MCVLYEEGKTPLAISLALATAPAATCPARACSAPHRVPITIRRPYTLHRTPTFQYGGAASTHDSTNCLNNDQLPCANAVRSSEHADRSVVAPQSNSERRVRRKLPCCTQRARDQSS
jgi:hypothetical protein